MKKALTASVSLMLIGAASAWAGGDAAAGKEIFANTCEECHFEDDFSGTSEEDMMAMIKAVLSGETEHEDQDLNEFGLSEEDLANVARLDLAMGLTAIGLAFLAALAAGLYPAWRVGRAVPVRFLKSQ